VVVSSRVEVVVVRVGVIVVVLVGVVVVVVVGDVVPNLINGPIIRALCYVSRTPGEKIPAPPGCRVF
jgi:hypothetical protein